MNGFIYKITNRVNNKVYIGQTRFTIEHRFKQHIKNYNIEHRKQALYLAFDKYGIENFVVEQVEECPIEKLDEREIYWIAYYDSFKNGYNLTLGGNSNRFSLCKLENSINIEKLKQYIIEFRPLATEVASHFGISKCSVYNLINRLNDPKLILNSYNPRKGKTIEDINKDELLALYNDGWSIRDLVKKFHIVKPKISKFLKENGIKIRRGVKGYIRRI